MRRLSDEQIIQINKDKQRINMGNSLELPKSMSYKDFVELLKEHGTSRVAKYFGRSKESESDDFSIDGSLDLSIILAYWRIRYDEDKVIYLPRLLEGMDKEFSLIIRDDPVEICVRRKYGLSEDGYNALSDEDRNRMRKEVEDDQSIIYAFGCIFYIKKEYDQ